MLSHWLIGALAVAVGITVQLVRVFGRSGGVKLGLLATLALVGGWWYLASADPPDARPSDWSAVASVPSEACAKCHQSHYDSWHRTYHRSMTREATPETVKGDFNDALHLYQGLETRFTRDGNGFFVDTIEPGWAAQLARAGGKAEGLPPPAYVRLKVHRLVGSHWIQECLHQEPSGRYFRLPVLYHIVEKRWVHTNGAFLAPDTHDFWHMCRGATWNETCLYCHNTGPIKNPVRGGGGRVSGYRTEVAELGISCEACHGPGSDHIRLNHNPARRFAVRGAGEGDPSIVHPLRLPVPRRDEICARCHGGLVPKPEAWDSRTHRDPFIAGQDLGRFNWFFKSEAEQAARVGARPLATVPGHPEATDGRFWGDGTPLTTALEYNGMALSACYQNGHGNLSCLSCHTMHGDDPNFLLKPGMQTNEACYQCHSGYRERLAEHTRHPADSPGSLCYNCHMPHQVYSLLTTHRSHRIQNPDVKDSLGTGKPNACTLCHLDKSLGWVQDQLERWPDRRPKPRPELSEDERNVSAALLLLAKGDARSRVVVAGAFSNPAAHKTAGTDWYGPFLTRLMAEDRYPAVRYLAHRGLVSVHGDAGAGPFDYLGTAAARAGQLAAMRARFDSASVTPRPYLPVTPSGKVDDAVLRRLLSARTDPDLAINE
jgi:predicted CXXCH cytochrome family protein